MARRRRAFLWVVGFTCFTFGLLQTILHFHQNRKDQNLAPVHFDKIRERYINALVNQTSGDLCQSDQADTILRYRQFQLPLPHFISSRDRVWFAHNQDNQELLTPRPNSKLRGVISFQHQGNIRDSIQCGWPSDIAQFTQVPEKPRQNTVYIKETVCPLLVPQSWAFQHFLDGVVPKIVQAYNILSKPEVRLLIYNPRDPIIHEMMSQLGFASNKYILYLPGQTFVAKCLLNTCITPPVHPDLWQRARRMLGGEERLQSSPHDAHVVLLTRTGSRNRGRNMVNEAGVIRFLSDRYGHKRVYVFRGGLDLQESIKIFTRTRIVVGVHGGAFYNTIFCPNGTSVIEIMPVTKYGATPPRLAHTIIWQQSGSLGHHYWRLASVKVPNTSLDVHVDLDRLGEALDQAEYILNRNVKL